MLHIILKNLSLTCQFITDSLWSLLHILLFSCIFISVGNAILRKLSDYGSNAFLECQWYLFSAVFLLGAGALLKKDAHIRIDIFYAYFSVKTQSWINLILHLLLTLPMMIFLIYSSVPFFLSAMSPDTGLISLIDVPRYVFESRYHEMSPNAGGLPTWYAKILLPIGFVLFLFGVIADILRQLIYIMFGDQA